MGSKTIDWCDRCGRKNPETLTGYWFGLPSVFYDKHSHIIPPDKNHRVSLCENCLSYIENEIKKWRKYRDSEPLQK